MTITKGTRVQFECGLDMLRGNVIARYADPKRPDMEETWTCYADQVLVRKPMLDEQGKQKTQPGKPLTNANGEQLLDAKGEPKCRPEPMFTESWVTLVDDDGVQKCDDEGNARHQSAAGGPLQLVKGGIPVPFRVRARRMTKV